MKPFNSLFLLFTLMAATLADISINNPIEGTTWNAGKPATITWIDDNNGLKAGNMVPVELMRGNPDALTLISVLGQADESQKSFEFTPASDLPAGNDYVVRIGGKYSHAFTINAASPSTTPNTSSNNNNTTNNTTTTGNSTNSASNSTTSTTNNTSTTSNTTAKNASNTNTSSANETNGTSQAASSNKAVVGMEGLMTASFLMFVSQQIY